MENKIILYAHPSCPMLPPVWGMLKAAHVDFEYINIHQDDRARELVRQINNGFESVPTLVFADGSTLTEPSGRVLARKLKSLGYHIPISAWLSSYSFQIIIGFFILFGILKFLAVI